MKQLIFIGAPGSGKGTQSESLIKQNSYRHISTGDLLRKEIAEGSQLGKTVKEIMDKGNLVTDAIVLELLKKNCDLKNGKYIFDGYPRNFDQAKVLVQQFLANQDFLAIYFHIDTGVLVERLTNRRSCSGCGAIYNIKFSPPKTLNVCDRCGHTPLTHRSDDHVDVVTNRIDVFKKSIDPVIEYFKSLGRLETIDAAKSSDWVYQQILSKI